jgi:hypothetical protein
MGSNHFARGGIFSNRIVAVRHLAALFEAAGEMSSHEHEIPGSWPTAALTSSPDAESEEVASSQVLGRRVSLLAFRERMDIIPRHCRLTPGA